MRVMADESGSFPRRHGRPLTVRDLEDMPDDGNRYELIDEELIVSPASAYRHQKLAMKLGVRLDTVAHPGSWSRCSRRRAWSPT